MSKSDTVHFELDPEQPSPLSASQNAEVEALRLAQDTRVDTSDIPELTEEFWKNARRNPFYRPVKQQLTIRLDADILAWLRSSGRRYQSKLNAILRQAMLSEGSKQ